MTTDTREALAAYAHEAWAGWMQWLFQFGEQHADGTFTINADKVARWRRQMMTTYADLPESEKESDRKEADAMLTLVYARQAELLDALHAAEQERNAARVERDEAIKMVEDAATKHLAQLNKLALARRWARAWKHAAEVYRSAASVAKHAYRYDGVTRRAYQTRIEALEAALQRYAMHDLDCACGTGAACNCGFDAALSDLPPIFGRRAWREGE